MIINLEKEDIGRCTEFAKKFISAGKSGKDFGNRELQRDKKDKLADCLEGKMGEAAFRRFCINRRADIEIDYSVTEGALEIDSGQDILTVSGRRPNIKYDIKTTKFYSKWLLIEKHKADEQLIKPDLYILMKIDLPGDIETNLRGFPSEKARCEFAGFILYEDLFDKNGEPWTSFKKNDPLFHPNYIGSLYRKAADKYGRVTDIRQLAEFGKDYYGQKYLNVRLKAPLNYGLPIEFIRKDVSQLLDIIKSDAIPPDLRSQKILRPYY